MFNLIASAVSNRRTIAAIIVIWVIFAGVIQQVAPSIEEVSTNEAAEFLPTGTEAFMAIELADEKFATTGGTPAIIVVRNPGGLTEADISKATRFVAVLESDEAPTNVVRVISDLGSSRPAGPPNSQQPVRTSPDGTAITITAIISGSRSDVAFDNTVDWLRELDDVVGLTGDAAVYVTGPAGIIKDAVDVFRSIDFRVTLITVGLVLVLMLLIYRSPLLALLPLISVGVALVVAQAVAALLTDNFGLALNGQVTAIMSVLMFGVGTDFTLFTVSRYREEIIRHESRFFAIAATVRAVGPSIASSAGTTVIAMLALILALSGSLKTMGPMLAMAVFVTLIASLTITPALLVAMGRVAFWPIDPYAKHESRDSRIWSRVAGIVAKKPGLIIVTTTIGLAALGSGMLTLEPRFSFLEGFPKDVESRLGFEALAESYPPGELAPTSVYVSVEGASVYDHLDAIATLSSMLESDPSVDRVLSVTQPLGEATSVSNDDIRTALAFVPADLENIPPDALANIPAEQIAVVQNVIAGSRFVSDDRTTSKIDLVFSNDPYSVEAMDAIPRLRETAKSTATQTSLADAIVLVGGETATQTDQRSTSERDIIVISPIVSVAIWVILALLLGSIVAPTYLVLTVALSFVAAMGLSVLIFQNVMGHEGFAFGSIPFVFVFLVALGADYNIYIMSRIREETANRGLVDGTKHAITRTGGVITSAGIILAGTFSVLATFPLRDLVQLGFTVMIGILLDTFIVRGILVPAIVIKLGEWNWWPSKMPKRSEGATPAVLETEA